ncbi:PKD domain-containing protein [bacterium]|nr:PKD domain-containing protein [bacterium]
MTARYLKLIPLACLLALAFSCGTGSQPQPESGKGQPLVGPEQQSSASGEVQRDASGLPSGILLSWDPVPDGVDESITGYHIYRSNEPILDSMRGDSSLWLSAEGFGDDGEGNATVYPATIIPFGQQYSHLDTKDTGFELNFGETWYYRFSALNDSGDEGLLSEEVIVNISQHQVNSLSALQGFVGDQIIVEGVRFGIFDASTDSVTFVGTEWNPDQTTPSMETVDIEANILSWSNTQILVEVPFGATVGRVKVWIDGVPAFPLQQFTCQSPYITDINPYSRYSEQAFEISGSNFGDAFGPNNIIVMDGKDIASSEAYIIYTDLLIRFSVPSGTSFGEHQIEVRSGTEKTQVGFINILNHPPVAQFSMNVTSGAVPLQVNFNAGPSMDADDGIAEWMFDFGDGTTASTTDPTKLIFPHIFDTIGIKQVTLTVTDNAGETDSITKSVNVLPAADILVVSDQWNGAGPGNEFTANFIALTNDLDTLGASYVVGGYSVGISQVAVDQGFSVVIWNHGGPGPGDPIQNWPRNWTDDEKVDFLGILDAGIPTLLLSQNHQFTGDYGSQPGFSSKYNMDLQNDTIVEGGSSRPFSWAFGTATDEELIDAGGLSFPISPVCLLNQSATPSLIRINPAAAEQYSGAGSSGLQPSTCRIGQRIQGAIIYDTINSNGATHPGFIPGMAFPDADPPFWLCFSYGMETAPDSNIGFGGTYSHNNGPAKLWVIGWSYSEAQFTPDPIQRHDVLQNVLAWLDSSLF